MDVEDWLAARSDDFQALHAAIGDLVRARWPDAERKVVGEGSYEMPAYVVPVPEHPPRESWTGTMPHDVFIIAPTEKKAGVTTHLWHPNRPGLIQENAEWLAAAGYKPMVGCLQWNRKATMDLDALARLLDDV